MLSSLSVFFKTSFKLSLSCRNNKAGDIGKCSTHDHVGHVVLVAWSIKNSVLLLLGVELSTTDFNSLTLGFLVITDIHYVSEPPRVTTLLLGLLLVLLNSSLVYHSVKEHKVAANGGLACVDVTDEDHGAGLSLRIHLLKVSFVDGHGLEFCDFLFSRIDIDNLTLRFPLLLFLIKFILILLLLLCLCILLILLPLLPLWKVRSDTTLVPGVRLELLHFFFVLAGRDAALLGTSVPLLLLLCLAVQPGHHIVGSATILRIVQKHETILLRV